MAVKPAIRTAYDGVRVADDDVFSLLTPLALSRVLRPSAM